MGQRAHSHFLQSLVTIILFFPLKILGRLQAQLPFSESEYADEWDLNFQENDAITVPMISLSSLYNQYLLILLLQFLCHASR